MKTKNTPGPWICHSGMVWKPDDTEDGTPIARMDRDTDRTSPTERDANARLIAAAPELLQIAEDYVLLCELHDLEGSVLDAAREAIAKAKGGK